MYAEKYWILCFIGSMSDKLLLNLRRLLKFWNLFISAIPSKVKSPRLHRSVACGCQIWSKSTPPPPISTEASCCIVGVSDRLDLLLYDWIVLHTTGHFDWAKPKIIPPQHGFLKATLLTYNYSVVNVVLEMTPRLTKRFQRAMMFSFNSWHLL